MRLYGKNPVIERLKANPKSIKRIMIEEEHVDLAYIRKKGQRGDFGDSCPVYQNPKTGPRISIRREFWRTLKIIPMSSWMICWKKLGKKKSGLVFG